MIRKIISVFFLTFLVACGGPPNNPRITPTQQTASSQKPVGYYYNDRVPDFAVRNYEPFSRQEVVALTLREWRVFNQPIADEDPLQRPEPTSPDVKAERSSGLWQRVGEYWWIGMDPGMKEGSYTGKHNSNGTVFNFINDGNYAWSAAFISYIMRIAGANDRFPYSPNHSTYINAAASGTSPVLRGHDPATYAPKLGDMICTARGKNRNTIRFNTLPTTYGFPAHCGIVVMTNQNMQPFGKEISIIGGNVNDSVALTHVPVDTQGMISNANGASYDYRYPWCIVIEIVYDAEASPSTNM